MLADTADETDMKHVFNYLFNVHYSCLETEYVVTDECATKVMEQLELPVEDIEECVDMSFEFPDDMQSENDILRMDRDSAVDMGIQLNPSLTINGKIYHGKLRGDKIFESICSAYARNHRPEVCHENYELATKLGDFEEDFVLPEGYGHHHLIIILVLVVLLNLFLFIWCKNRKRKDDDAVMQT